MYGRQGTETQPPITDRQTDRQTDSQADIMSQLRFYSVHSHDTELREVAKGASEQNSIRRAHKSAEVVNHYISFITSHSATHSWLICDCSPSSLICSTTALTATLLQSILTSPLGRSLHLHSRDVFGGQMAPTRTPPHTQSNTNNLDKLPRRAAMASRSAIP